METARNLLGVLKKILFWFGGAMVFVVIGYAAFWYYSQLPKAAEKLVGVSLGTTKEEVLYLLGNPSNYFYSHPDDNRGNSPSEFLRVLTPTEAEKIKPKIEFDYWSYQNKHKEARVDVEFDPESKKVTSVTCFVDLKAWHSYNICPVSEIAIPQSEESVVSRLGQPTEHSFAGTVKTALYPKLNLRLLYEQQNLYSIEMVKF